MEQTILVRYITKLLILLGFSPRHYGYTYIREMIVFSMNSKDKKLSSVYSSVSEKHNQPVEAVQTAVRTALKNAQQQASFGNLEVLLGAKFIEPRYILPPREFIGIITEYLTYVWDGKDGSIKI